MTEVKETFEDIMNEDMGLIVDIADLDRVSVWRNIKKADGLYVTQVYCWDRESGGTTTPAKEFGDVAYSRLVPHWEYLLAGGGIINSPVRLLPEASLLRSFGAMSVFVAPVFIGNVFWGTVLFEDHRKEHYFDVDCIETMRSAAFLCANTVIRAEMENKLAATNELLKTRLEHQELISEISRSLIPPGDSEMYIKEAIAKLGHYHNVSMVCIYSIDYQRDETNLAYHWAADGTAACAASFDFLSLLKSSFPDRLPECGTAPLVSCTDVASSTATAFHSLLSMDINAFICTPLYVKGRLWGILNVGQCFAPRTWTDNEKRFVTMTASTIAGVITRNIYNSMLEDALHKATTASRAKGDFLANMSHEMRTPLNAIIGMTSIGKDALDIERKNYALDKIEIASTHLLGVINDVLDMAKIEANNLKLAPVEFDVEGVLQKVVTVSGFRIEEKKLNFKMLIDDSIPKTLFGDDLRLAQVITNLLGNAVKFTPENGSITLEARLLEEKKGILTIQFSVADTGIGLSDEQQNRLFQSFEQAESSTAREYGGTGLGLSISKRIVEIMGGEIWICSELGKGATFAFKVPLRRGTKKKQKGDVKKTKANANSVFAGRRILLAEDVDINREIVLTLLEPTLVKIDCAENGSEAVRMFSETPEKYDLIFMDVQMPEMDGHEATRRIRALESERYSSSKAQIPIIAMTANVFREDVEKCFEAGMNGHIKKPLSFNEVLDKLREHLPV